MSDRQPQTTDLLMRLQAYAKDWRERAASKDVVEEAAAEIERLRRVLKWARTCVPFPSDCHTAIVGALEERGEDCRYCIDNDISMYQAVSHAIGELHPSPGPNER